MLEGRPLTESLKAGKIGALRLLAKGQCRWVNGGKVIALTERQG